MIYDITLSEELLEAFSIIENFRKKIRTLLLEEPIVGDPDRETIALDYDGVINSYLKKRGPNEQGIFEDEYDYPLPGVKEWIEDLLTEYNIVIFTCRALVPEGKEGVQNWLRRWGFPSLPVTSRKPLACLYCDDNAYRISRGDYPSREKIRSLKSWVHDLRKENGL